MCQELSPTASVPCLPSSGCRSGPPGRTLSCEGLGLLGVFLLILKTVNQPLHASTQAGRMGEEPSQGGGTGQRSMVGLPGEDVGLKVSTGISPQCLHLPHRPGAARGRGWRAPEVHSRAAAGHQTLDDIILTP